ncbi:glycosyltransferase family 2 protein [Lactobacillus sp. CBA3605]|uniref:glycosyltransferase n=1 Tax=Lactobacillus sp. CBA3605 TaxID=2099788 RepID=UPI001F465480|nr:glycosyltransferase family 2 protein [Lactobacillus sp. CBA3605]
MVKISIIIPTYNSVATIDRLITSIIQQTGFQDYEIICVDDGSTDQTWGRLQELASQHPMIRCYRQTNQKQAAARNNGLRHALGDYVMFADADDYWLPGLFEAVVPDLKQALTIFGIQKDYDQKQVLEVQSGTKGSHNQQQLIQNYLAKNVEMDVGVWNKVFSKAMIDHYQFQFSNGNFFEDSSFVLAFLAHVTPKDIRYIEKPFYVLNKHANTTTSQFSPAIIERAQRYYRGVVTTLTELHYADQTQQAILTALRCRLLLHVSHHYLVNNPQWSPQWERHFLAARLKTLPMLTNRLITWKYKLAYLTLRYVPRVYRLAYLNYKPEI